MTHLICSRCGVTKAVNCFYADTRYRNGYRGVCKECLQFENRQWKKAHPESVRHSSQKYGQSHKEARRETQNAWLRSKSPQYRSSKWRQADIKRRYAASPAWFDDKLKEQGGGCALCGVLYNGYVGRRLCIDHNHSTGELRGLLCSVCNHAVERIENVDKWLDKARAYLDYYDNNTKVDRK